MIEPVSRLIQVQRVSEKEESRCKRYRLDRSERTYPFGDKFIEKIKQRIDSDLLSVYPEPDRLYEKMAEFLQLPQSNIIFHSGSDLGIKSVFETYIEPGDKILLPRPCYAMYHVYAKIFGAQTELVEFDEELRFDFDEFLSRINQDIRMVVIENPSGFLGIAPPENRLHEILSACEKAGCILLVDEAYYYFHDVTLAKLAAEHENLIITRTFSKSFGLAGLRAGYLISNPRNLSSLDKVKPMHQLNSFAVLVIEELLDQIDEMYSYVEQTRIDRDYFQKKFSDMGIATSESVGNFFAARIGSLTSKYKIKDEAFASGILIRRPFTEPKIKEWSRIGTGPRLAMDELIRIIASALEKEKAGKRAAV